MERREPQAADILLIEIAGEFMVGAFGARQRAERRKAHAVVQAVRLAVKTHRIGHGAVAFAAERPEQRGHPGGEIHIRCRIICGAAGRH